MAIVHRQLFVGSAIWQMANQNAFCLAHPTCLSHPTHRTSQNCSEEQLAGALKAGDKFAAYHPCGECSFGTDECNTDPRCNCPDSTHAKVAFTPVGTDAPCHRCVGHCTCTPIVICIAASLHPDQWRLRGASAVLRKCVGETGVHRYSIVRAQAVPIVLHFTLPLILSNLILTCTFASIACEPNTDFRLDAANLPWHGYAMRRPTNYIGECVTS